MRYLEGHFTLPTCRKRLTDEEYNRAVGNLPAEEKSDVVPPLPELQDDSPEENTR